MKKKALLLVLSVIMVFTMSMTAVAADTFKWVGQSCFPIQLPVGMYFPMWADNVEEMSGGRLTIEVHGAGEIVPATSVFDSVRDGVLDCGQNTPAFQKGQYPAGDLFYTLPGGITETNDLLVWMYGGEGQELAQEMYGDIIKVFPLGLTPPEEIWSTKPVRTLDDIKGLKVRSAGLSMELWEKLGASVVLLPGGEVVPSLRRGVIDAAEFAFPSMDVGLGLHEVCDYVFGPPIHMGSNIFQLLINPKAWEKLPADLQEIVKNAAIASTFEGYARFWIDSIQAFEEIKEAGVEVIKLSPEDQQKALQLSYEILDEKSAEDPMFKKVWESQKNFLESYQEFNNLTKFDK
jgi:TRAP-type mannitol/chloroaromatic compound transport system substrate-binding protein